MRNELYAAIDLGSNSFRLIIAKCRGEGFDVLINARERVQMAKGLDMARNIDAVYWQRGLAACQIFSVLLKSYRPVQVRIVATNVFRVANNARAWVKDAEKILENKIEIISGKKEAELIYRGAVADMACPQKKLFVVDIGGGSTEFSIGCQDNIEDLASCSMGCITYHQKYFRDQDITEKQFAQAIHAAKKMLAKTKIGDSHRWDVCLGSSGTIGACYFLLQKLERADDAITLAGLNYLRQALLELKFHDQLPKLGLSADRKEIFPSGLAILIAIFEAFAIEQMFFTRATIREGVLWEMVRARR